MIRYYRLGVYDHILSLTPTPSCVFASLRAASLACHCRRSLSLSLVSGACVRQSCCCCYSDHGHIESARCRSHAFQLPDKTLCHSVPGALLVATLLPTTPSIQDRSADGRRQHPDRSIPHYLLQPSSLRPAAAAVHAPVCQPAPASPPTSVAAQRLAPQSQSCLRRFCSSTNVAKMRRVV
jgi:hypothetical protein